MQSTTALSEIIRLLQGSQHVLMFTHVSPDGDAIGSLLGLGWLLQGQGKATTLVDADPVPAELRHLPGAGQIIAEPPRARWDAVVALDASDAQRLGPSFHPTEYGDAPIIVIDHHITNQRFGAFNLIEPAAAATAQVLVQLADAWPVPITQPAATCLLAGLVTDTRGFRTSNVTIEVMATAMRLMEDGANLAEIAERSLDYKPLGLMRLWGLALAGVQVDGRIIWTQITQAMRDQVQALNGNDGGLVSFLLNAPEANVAVVFSEKRDGRVEVSLRSRPGFDVSGLALDLGGGGHPQAAGCSITGPLADVEARVLAAIRGVKRTEG